MHLWRVYFENQAKQCTQIDIYAFIFLWLRVCKSFEGLKIFKKTKIFNLDKLTIKSHSEDTMLSFLDII